MQEGNKSPEELINEREAEVQRLKEFIQSTSFAGDEREVADELSSTVDNHPADVADVTFQREFDQTAEKVLEQEEKLIEDARKRLAEGKYGICDVCGRPIGEERLRARPQSIRCVDCQAKFEKGQI